MHKETPGINEVLEALEDMVLQHCDEQDDGTLFSGFLSANADAMRLLARYGRMTLTMDEPGTRTVAGMLTEE